MLCYDKVPSATHWVTDCGPVFQLIFFLPVSSLTDSSLANRQPNFLRPAELARHSLYIPAHHQISWDKCAGGRVLVECSRLGGCILYSNATDTYLFEAIMNDLI